MQHYPDRFALFIKNNFMKKIVFTAIGVLMTGVMIFAQIRTSKTFAAFTAGPSYPVGLFSNTNIDEPNAGMAKNGFNIDVKLGHQFDQVFGITGGLTYGRYAVQDPHYYYYYSLIYINFLDLFV